MDGGEERVCWGDIKYGPSRLSPRHHNVGRLGATCGQAENVGLLHSLPAAWPWYPAKGAILRVGVWACCAGSQWEAKSRQPPAAVPCCACLVEPMACTRWRWMAHQGDVCDVFLATYTSLLDYPVVRDV